MLHRSRTLTTLAATLLTACIGPLEGSKVGDHEADTLASPEAMDDADPAAPDLPQDAADVLATELPHAQADAPDSAADAGSEPLPSAGGVLVDWAVQSTSGQLEAPTGIALRDGGLAFVANFAGTVTLGSHAVSAPSDGSAHTLFAHIDATGEVVALTRLCDGCGGGGPFALAELPSGEVGVAAVSDGEVVLNPGTTREARASAEHDLFVGVIARAAAGGGSSTVSHAGGLSRSAFLGRFAGWGEVGALAATRDGGLVVAGSGKSLTFHTGPELPPSTSASPGRAYVVGVSAELEPHFAEQLGGEASSRIHLLHASEDGLVAVGDLGGWRSMSALFGVGRENSVALAVASATEDPTNDLFVSRWSLPATLGRPRLEWARRIAHRSDAPRVATWLRATEGSPAEGALGAARQFEFRLDGASTLVPDASGEFRAETSRATAEPAERLVVRLGDGGGASPFLTTIAPIAPRPNEDDLLRDDASDGYLSLALSENGADLQLLAGDGPSFTLPTSDGDAWEGLVVARWFANGTPSEAGLLPLRRPARSSAYPTILHAAYPQRAGAALVLLRSSVPLELVPSEGEPVTLSIPEGVLRVVVARVRLGGGPVSR